jgi:S-DNA-T family DNA segregation ATPase FtsK/SpoIIIE
MAERKPSSPPRASMAHAPQPARTLWERLAWLRRRPGDAASDVIGVALMALALITILGLLGLTQGAWLSPWVGVMRRWLGVGSILVVVGLGLAGWQLLQRRRLGAGLAPGRLIAFEVTVFALLALLSILTGLSLEQAEAGRAGGLIGWGLAEGLRLLLDSVLPNWLALGLSGLLWLAVAGLAGLLTLQRRAWPTGAEPQRMPEYEAVHEPVFTASPMAPEAEAEEAAAAPRVRKPRLPAEYRKDFKLSEEQKPAALKTAPRAADLPPLKLLVEERSTRPDERHINEMGGLLEKALAELGVPAKVVDFQVGPTVTQFAVEPGYIQRPGDPPGQGGQRVRVSQISALQRDLALALSAQRLRIQAPVPGRAYVGIEVPNRRTMTVRMRPILESMAFHKLNSPLGIALGRDVSGEPIAADLARMPHLLVAGTTGSGKSVLISAIAVCLMMNNSPADLRLVMLDPKMVELVRFNGLPHLIGKVETELERITASLRWVVAEMQRRYKLLEQERVRDIDGFNRKVEKQDDAERLPRIVVLIDELADLMMNTAEHTESTLVRLAQMARAVGIHLVVATQRPSTDVVTGLIKANFPARISFAVASAIDSRVILDTTGAEALLGRGDMLYLSPEAAGPLRSQGVMITDAEIEAVIAYWQHAWPADGAEAAPWDGLLQREALSEDRDELIDRAIDVIRATGKSSASHLQRALKVGYPRAARLVDELEEMGVLGPAQSGGREREVLMDLDAFVGEEGDEE